MSITLQSTSTLLFIGDSITDCGRRECPDQIGAGYVRMVRDYLAAKNPAGAPRVVNTGISGNKVTDLQARWETDVLAHAPDVLSIKIGINDVWHGLHDPSNGIPTDRFISVYQDILRRTRARLPQCNLILCEPSVIWPPQPEHGNDALQPYIRAVHDLAREFDTETVVPLHNAFVKAREARPDIVWAADGVHPSSTGHMLIARTWLQSTQLL